METILENRVAGVAVERFINHPLMRSAKELTVESPDKEKIVTIGSEEASCFVPTDSEDILSEVTVQKALQIIAADFHGGKWRLYDGERSLWASINDLEFLNRIYSGEPFSKGDFLQVSLKTTQKLIDGRLKSESVIETVLQHRKGEKQAGFFDDD